MVCAAARREPNLKVKFLLTFISGWDFLNNGIGFRLRRLQSVVTLLDRSSVRERSGDIRTPRFHPPTHPCLPSDYWTSITGKTQAPLSRIGIHGWGSTAP